jgi:hypothetical protein
MHLIPCISTSGNLKIMIQNLVRLLQYRLMPHGLLLYAMIHPCFIHACITVTQDTFFIRFYTEMHSQTPSHAMQ